ncbi:SagB family peptide dehydrogenase [Microbulbifer sp. 2205BS26-8]|uniref:SagB family peptide dehydrogenase n=1 Tax=Microbulbifer sp. 2205BS26-8 TaxID=3064386 RepID=UPI00273E09C1|nr:SagB family peptide dehydrogenase [Microbulbifer sp. 2205BS26-8]MDP5210780.1 SagB family peptide dehydrogenase [Microbulbifer sp. 2205BS26-8]
MSVALSQSADSIGNSFASDPELQLPQYPRFPPEVLMISYRQTGLLFEGVHGTQVLSGRGARGFIPKLLARLDGTRDLAALSRDFPQIPKKSLRDAIALLYSRGLLEDGLGAEPAGEQEELAAFAGRYIDVTRANRNRGEVLARLADKRVCLVGQSSALETLSVALADLGLKEIRRAQDPEQLQGIDLVVALFTGETPESQRALWLNTAQEQGVRVLHAHLGNGAVEIGPLFIPGKSACYDCLRSLHAAPSGVPAQGQGFWVANLALQAFHLLSRLGRPNLYNVCHIHQGDESGAAYREVQLARLPGCASCGLAECTPRLDEEHGQVWLLHNAANTMPPRDLLSPRDYQMHYAAGNLLITQESPEPYYGALPKALPEGLSLEAAPSWLRGATGAGHADIDTLSSLLRLSVGYQPQSDGGQRRVAPSAGGLGSAEIFVLVRDVPGLEPGVYHYYAWAHRLDRLRGMSPPLIAGALGLRERDLPPLLLVGVGSLGKLRQKYGDFAFRFASLDAGFVRVYLYELMDAMGLPFVEYADARDQVLAQTLGLPVVGGRNMVTFVLGVGVPTGEQGPGLLRAHQNVDSLIELASQANAPLRAGVDHAEARCEWAPLGAGGPQAILSRLDQLFLERRSARRFASQPLPMPLLNRLADLAIGTNDWLGRSGGLPLRLRLWAAVNAGGADPSVDIYAWDPQGNEWVKQRSGVAAEALDAAILQRNLARAPVVLFVTGDFQQAVSEQGARGYRELIGRAGAVVARTLLAATSYGLTGCPWGGLSEDGWGELFSIDRYRDCPLFGLSLGYADVG